MRLIGTFSSDVAEFREPHSRFVWRSFIGHRELGGAPLSPVLTGGALSSDIAEPREQSVRLALFHRTSLSLESSLMLFRWTSLSLERKEPFSPSPSGSNSIEVTAEC